MYIYICIYIYILCICESVFQPDILCCCHVWELPRWAPRPKISSTANDLEYGQSLYSNNLQFKGWNVHVHRECPGKFESTNLSSDHIIITLGCGMGKHAHVCVYIYIYIYIDIYICICMYVYIYIYILVLLDWARDSAPRGELTRLASLPRAFILPAQPPAEFFVVWPISALREFPIHFGSTNLRRDNLSREIGRRRWNFPKRVADPENYPLKDLGGESLGGEIGPQVGRTAKKGRGSWSIHNWLLYFIVLYCIIHIILCNIIWYYIIRYHIVLYNMI